MVITVCAAADVVVQLHASDCIRWGQREPHSPGYTQHLQPSQAAQQPQLSGLVLVGRRRVLHGPSGKFFTGAPAKAWKQNSTGRRIGSIPKGFKLVLGYIAA